MEQFAKTIMILSMKIFFVFFFQFFPHFNHLFRERMDTIFDVERSCV